jgi:hypothetical protein
VIGERVIAGLEPDRLVEIGQPALMVAHRRVGLAAQDVAAREIGLELDRAGEVGDGALVLTAGAERPAASEPRIFEGGHKLDRNVVVGDRAAEILGHQQGECAIVVGHREVAAFVAAAGDQARAGLGLRFGRTLAVTDLAVFDKAGCRRS